MSNEPQREAAPLAGQRVECGTDSETGELTVKTQAAIDELAGCEILRAGLVIEFSDPALDLQPLETLRVIEGQLRVAAPWSFERVPVRLRSLHGLEGLRSVASLTVSGVESGLGPLSQLSGDVTELILEDLPGVRDLSVLGGLRVTRLFSLDLMPDLERLGPVALAPQLESVSISTAPQLTSLAGLEGLVELRSLDLRDVGLRELALPDSLVSLPYVSISGASELTSLAELSRRPGVLGLRVGSNPRLTDLGGNGSSDSSLQQLAVYACPSLTEIHPVGGFSALTNVEITDCDGITQIDRIAESSALQMLQIRGNAALTRLPVFERAPAQMVQIRIADNAALVQGPSFPNLTRLYYFETPYYESAELELSNNPLLAAIGEYPQLESLTMLALNQQPALTSLTLPSLRSLGWLRVRDNASLTRVELAVREGLSIIEVAGNPKLEVLSLGPASGLLQRLQLQENPALAGEDRQRLLDRINELTEATLD